MPGNVTRSLNDEPSDPLNLSIPSMVDFNSFVDGGDFRTFVSRESSALGCIPSLVALTSVSHALVCSAPACVRIKTVPGIAPRCHHARREKHAIDRAANRMSKLLGVVPRLELSFARAGSQGLAYASSLDSAGAQ